MTRFLVALTIPVGILAFMAVIIAAMAVLLTASGKILAPAVAIVLAAVVMVAAAMLADMPPKALDAGRTADIRAGVQLAIARSSKFLVALAIPVGILGFMVVIIAGMAVLLTTSGKILAPAVAIVLAAVVMVIAAMLADMPPKSEEQGQNAIHRLGLK